MWILTLRLRFKKRKKTRQNAALKTPGRTDPRQPAHQQSQVETTHVDQQSLRAIGVTPNEDAAQPARGELMRERLLHQLAPLQPSSPAAPNPSTIRVHRCLALSILPLTPDYS